jgi:uncharacterized protein YyaL (SSP411 family)
MDATLLNDDHIDSSLAQRIHHIGQLVNRPEHLDRRASTRQRQLVRQRRSTFQDHDPSLVHHPCIGMGDNRPERETGVMGGYRLADATSPYLLQHASNPVEWYPWGDEAFEAAVTRDVPIFLSVGYAACHWCHVMERESFENDEIAAFLNEHFVAVKVDREERPDVDAIYMTAVQAMTGQGGWPMSVFLTPQGEPFWAATYLPDSPRHGMPSFGQVLEGLAEAWASRRGDILQQGATVTAAIERTTNATATGPAPDPAIALEHLASAFDERWGGFGGAPKFPQVPVLEWLLRRAVRGDARAERMVVRTLEAMANGGIHDQVAGGFARYSTDVEWHVPHFEKMLYDNAQLLTLYTRAWLHTRNEAFRTVAESTATALTETFGLPEGGFASSTDADSEEREGAFATWTWDELVEVVGQAVADAYGARPEGNWEGTNVLWQPSPIDVVAARHKMTASALRSQLTTLRVKLVERRALRPQPAVDDKVVAAWNGLAISGLATIGRAVANQEWVAAAERCGDFVWQHMRIEGRLQRSWRAGRVSGPAFLDDHGLVALGMLTLFETTGDVRWYERARDLADTIERLFMTDDGARTLGSDAESLVVQPRERTDDVTPSGAAASAELFIRLSHLTGDASLEARGRGLIEIAGHLPERAPQAFGHVWCVLDLLEGPVREVAILGAAERPEMRALLREVVAKRYLPNVVLAFADPRSSLVEQVPLLRGRRADEAVPTAFVCEGFTCLLPVTAPDALAAQL